MDFSNLLNFRLKTKENDQGNKVIALAERSSAGNLSSFAGMFRVTSLSDKEKSLLTDILLEYRESDAYNTDDDLQNLLSLTAEVKAITNQAVILHGERIKKAQEILKNYKEGAFTAWLIATYGNRQTPYNFLQYYEFYTSMPAHIRPKIDEMPRQAIYTLASREGEPEKKLEIVQNYGGETKNEVLGLIRKLFPLDKTDRRLSNPAHIAIQSLLRLKETFEHSRFSPTDKQKEMISELMKDLKKILEKN